jgi:hypothetical protein
MHILHMRSNMCTCAHTWMHAHAHLRTHAHMLANTRIHMHVYKYTTHEYTHKYTLTTTCRPFNTQNHNFCLPHAPYLFRRVPFSERTVQP